MVAAKELYEMSCNYKTNKATIHQEIEKKKFTINFQDIKL